MVRKPFLSLFLWIVLGLILGGLPRLALAQSPPTHLPPPQARLGAPITEPVPVGLPDLVQLALEQNPLLQQAGLDVEAARGRAVQAGLYPNPMFMGMFDQMGDRMGSAGMIYLPRIDQQIVTAGKLKLDRAAANRQTDQARLALVRQRIVLITEVRKRYFAVLVLQERVAVLEHLVKLASEAVQTADKLVKARLIAELDLIQFRVELNRLAAKREAAERERVAAWHQLAAVIGISELPLSPVAGSLEVPLPEGEFEPLRQLMLARHPDVQSAEVEIIRAELVLKRAQVEKIPNVTVGAAYLRNNMSKSDDWMLQFNFPVPVFDRNQGNVQAARAQLAVAFQQVRRVDNELSQQLAAAFGQYAAALKQKERYQGVVKDAELAYQLSLKAFQGGEFEYLRVIAAQRAVAEANLEYLDILGQAWQAGSDIAGLLLEEDWPVCPLH